MTFRFWLASIVTFFLPAVVCSSDVVSHGLPPLHHPHPVHHLAYHPSPHPYKTVKKFPYQPSSQDNEKATKILKHTDDHSHQPALQYRDDPYEAQNYIPKQYNFIYSVKDSYSGDNFSHREKKTNVLTEGEYRVLLPDGRVQIVTYTADDGGYHAIVKYQGEAHYDQPNHQQLIGPVIKSRLHNSVLEEILDSEAPSTETPLILPPKSLLHPHSKSLPPIPRHLENKVILESEPPPTEPLLLSLNSLLHPYSHSLPPIPHHTENNAILQSETPSAEQPLVLHPNSLLHPRTDSLPPTPRHPETKYRYSPTPVPYQD